MYARQTTITIDKQFLALFQGEYRYDVSRNLDNIFIYDKHCVNAVTDSGANIPRRFIEPSRDSCTHDAIGC